MSVRKYVIIVVGRCGNNLAAYMYTIGYNSLQLKDHIVILVLLLIQHSSTLLCVYKPACC